MNHKSNCRILRILAIVLGVSIILGTKALYAQNDPEAGDVLQFNQLTSEATFTPVAYIIQLSPENATLAEDYDNISRKHIYGICWEGTNDDNLRFAKQMGYTHINYNSGMHNSALATNIYFLFQKPENLLVQHLGIKQVITLSTTYTPAVQNVYNNHYALKNLTQPFPNNIANGWFTFNTSKKPLTFAVVPDWQQKRVVDLSVDLAIAEAQRVERPANGFLFGGIAWDEAELTGDFSSDSAAFKKGLNTAVTLAFWTGGDSSRIFPGTTHEYAVHSDGKAAFYKELKRRFRDLYPERKLIYHWEPYKINGDLLKQIMLRSDKEELLSELLLTSEGEGNQLTQFADDASLFSSGLIKRDWVGSTQPNEHDYDKIKQIVGKAGIYGSWFGWFGRFNESGPPNNIYEIPRWEQLAREIPAWDNFCGVPLNQRSYNVTQYLSSNSCMSDKILYSRQPKTSKLFVVFMDPTGTVPLKPGERVISVSRVDSFFRENGDATSALKITENSISLATTSVKQVKFNRFSVSPNPAQDFIFLKANNPGKPVSYKIYDSIGKLVASDEMRDNENNIPIAGLLNGVYLLRVSDSENMESIKFIKEKK